MSIVLVYTIGEFEWNRIIPCLLYVWCGSEFSLSNTLNEAGVAKHSWKVSLVFLLSIKFLGLEKYIRWLIKWTTHEPCNNQSGTNIKIMDIFYCHHSTLDITHKGIHSLYKTKEEKNSFPRSRWQLY